MPHAHPSGFPPRSLACPRARRGTGPRPTVKGAVPDTVARGPVPRDLPINAAWRGTGPRPTVKRDVPDTVARGPVPRDLRRGTNPRAPVCSLRSPERNRIKSWKPVARASDDLALQEEALSYRRAVGKPVPRHAIDDFLLALGP